MSIFLYTIASIFSNLIPIAFKLIIDDAQADDFDGVYKVFVGIIFAVVANIIFRALGDEATDNVLFKSAREIRLAVFKHLHELDFAFHVEKSSGSMISLFKRGDGAYFNYYLNINVFSIQIIIDFFFMILVFTRVYPTLVWVSIGIFVANLIFMYFTVKNNIRERKKLNSFEDEITSITVDNMIAFDTVKYFTNEKYEQDRLEVVTENWRKAGMNYAHTFRVIDLGNGGIINLGMLLVVGIALYDLINGSVSLGDFVLAITFATLFFPKLIHMVFNFRELAKNHVDLEKYMAILDEKVEVIDKVDKKVINKWNKTIQEGEDFEILFDDVDFSYDKKNSALADINLSIKSGESVAFVGRSGAGKTTITKLLMRFYDPVKGTISMGGIDIKDVPKTTLRKKIGVVPQDPVLFNDTLAYNISYGKDEFTMEEIEVAAKLANLYEYIKTLPDGFMTEVGERGIKLSGGQKQRLAIARVILESAPIIMFDEATSSLDSESEKLIQEAFWDVAKDKTNIIIAHRLSTVQKADKIVVLDDSRIIEIGTHKELTNKDSGIYKYLWDLQTKGEITD